jgi:hypothetical protein
MEPSRHHLIMAPTSTQQTGFNRLLYRKQLVKKHATTVKMLADYGADLNARAVNPPSLYSGTALQQAAGRGGEAVVRTLLGAGVDPNAQCGHYGGISATMIKEEPVCEGSPG